MSGRCAALRLWCHHFQRVVAETVARPIQLSVIAGVTSRSVTHGAENSI